MAGSHELNGASGQTFLSAHAVLMGQASLHYIRAYLYVGMRVLTKSSLWLHQVVVQNAHDAEAHVAGVVIFCEREMESTLQPVPIGPAWV